MKRKKDSNKKNGFSSTTPNKRFLDFESNYLNCDNLFYELYQTRISLDSQFRVRIQ